MTFLVRCVGLLGVLPAALCAAAVLSPVQAHAPGQSGSSYKLVAGPWPVHVIDRLVLRDERRHKAVEMAVRYPAVSGTRVRAAFPLIVFSHGAGGSRKSFQDLVTFWAGHGYVVIAPTHDDVVRAGRIGHGRAFDEAPLDRLADLVFVLDSLPAIEKKMDGFHGRHATHIDRLRIGVAGQGTGALAAQMAIGVKVRSSRGENDVRDVGDHRFRAAIVVSAQSTVNRMLTRESWEDVTRPLLVVTGSRDIVATSRETPESRQEPFLLARPGQKYLLFVDGATHASFEGRWSSDTPSAAVVTTDAREINDADARMVSAVTASATLAFWDAFVAGDERGRDYLAGDGIVKLSGGRARIQRR